MPKPSDALKDEMPTVVLAGGKSRRFPGDKSLMMIDGKPQIVRIVQALKSQNRRVMVIADRSDRYSELAIPCEADSMPDCGPMGGILTGLELRYRHHGEGWLCVIGCDQLVWRNEWLRGISGSLALDPSSDGTQPPSYLVALWASPDSDPTAWPNPIPGVYHTKLLPVLYESIHRHQYSLRKLLQELGSAVLYHVQEIQPSSYSFNTREQLELLLQSFPNGVEFS